MALNCVEPLHGDPQGELEEAIVLAAEARALFLELGDEHGAAWATGSSAGAQFRLGNFGEAARRFAESAEMFVRVGDRSLLGLAVARLGAAVIHLNEPVRAARLLGAGERLMELTGVEANPEALAAIEEARAKAKAAAGDEAFHLAWTEGSLLATDEGVQLLVAEASQTASSVH